MKFTIDGKDYTLDELIALSKDPLKARSAFGDGANATVRMKDQILEGIRFPNRINFKAYDKDGNFKWEETCANIVTNQGLQHILDILFVSATTQIDPFYVGLIQDNSAASYVVAGDTAASHAGWTEDTTYSTSKPAFIDVRTSQSVDNSASTADFTINGAVTIAGACLLESSTKPATTGVLLCGGTFTGGDRLLANLDTLQVTYTFTAADDGV